MPNPLNFVIHCGNNPYLYDAMRYDLEKLGYYFEIGKSYDFITNFYKPDEIQVPCKDNFSKLKGVNEEPEDIPNTFILPVDYIKALDFAQDQLNVSSKFDFTLCLEKFRIFGKMAIGTSGHYIYKGELENILKLFK